MEVVNKLAHHGQGETLGVEAEDSSKVHVIDVGPHGLKGDVGQAVVLDNFGHVEGILVSISANSHTRVSFCILLIMCWGVSCVVHTCTGGSLGPSTAAWLGNPQIHHTAAQRPQE